MYAPFISSVWLFDVYIIDSEGRLVYYESADTLQDAIDCAIDANLPADQMCIVQRNNKEPRVVLIPSWMIPPVEAGMKPAGR